MSAQPGRHPLAATLRAYIYSNLVGTLMGIIIVGVAVIVGVAAAVKVWVTV
jgi:hypothetical protein